MLVRIWILIFCGIVTTLAPQNQLEQERVAQHERAIQRSKCYAMDYFLQSEIVFDLRQGRNPLSVELDEAHPIKGLQCIQDVLHCLDKTSLSEQEQWQAFLNKKLLSEVSKKQAPAELQLFLDDMFGVFYQTVASLNTETCSKILDKRTVNGVASIEQLPFMHCLPLDEGDGSGVFRLPAPYDSWLLYCVPQYKASLARQERLSECPFSLTATAGLENISRPFVHDYLRQFFKDKRMQGVDVPQAYFYHLPGHADDINDFNYAICVNMAHPLPLVEAARKIFNEQELQNILKERCAEDMMREVAQSKAIGSAMLHMGAHYTHNATKDDCIISIADVHSTSVLMDHLQIPSLSGGVNMLMPMTTVVLAFPDEIKAPYFELFNMILLADFYYKDLLKEIFLQAKEAVFLSLEAKEQLADANYVRAIEYNYFLWNFLTSSLDSSFQANWRTFLADENLVATLMRGRTTEVLRQELGDKMFELYCEKMLAMRRLLLSVTETPRSSQEIFKAVMAKRGSLRVFIPVQGYGGHTVEAGLLMEMLQFLFPQSSD